jgi:hypothetical protein
MHLKTVKENKSDRRRASKTQEICPFLLFITFFSLRKVGTSSQSVGYTILLFFFYVSTIKPTQRYLQQLSKKGVWDAQRPLIP